MIYPSTPTNFSSTIATGGTAQTAIARNARRKGFGVYNPAAATENLTINFLGTAGAGAGSGDITLIPGQEYEKTIGAIPNSAVSVNAPTTAHAFTAWEF